MLSLVFESTTPQRNLKQSFIMYISFVKAVR
jgi:hypothetical protein